mmetsp:Transcript_6955/g.11212  ORF Transcript_6955/g.11212 Transcript_6955/m.11212 type:complete len:218 (-) Transcript_6955:618-1271(-)
MSICAHCGSEATLRREEVFAILQRSKVICKSALVYFSCRMPDKGARCILRLHLVHELKLPHILSLLGFENCVKNCIALRVRNRGIAGSRLTLLWLRCTTGLLRSLTLLHLLLHLLHLLLHLRILHHLLHILLHHSHLLHARVCITLRCCICLLLLCHRPLQSCYLRLKLRDSHGYKFHLFRGPAASYEASFTMNSLCQLGLILCSFYLVRLRSIFIC